MNLGGLFSSKKKSEPQCVLVADDVATIRTIVSSVFRKAEYRVVEARNGDEVITLSREHKPDLIVLDLQMGSRDGLSAIDELLEDGDLQAIPVIVLSGETDLDRVELVKSRANVIDFITKDHLPNVIENLQKHTQ